MNDGNARQIMALKRQNEAMKLWLDQGYTRRHAAQMAIRLYPTPAQERIAKARAAKREVK